jgi:hypothetical protein
MKCLVRLSFVPLCVLTLAFTAGAQSKETTAPAKNRAAEDTAAAEALKERRAQARSLLLSLASDARSFRDQKLRARSLARIADTLWSADAEQSRTLFRKAWEAAETADQDQTTPNLGQAPLNLRGEVLKLAARRDRLLAEELLQKLKADQQETKTEHSKPSLWELPDSLERRLALARSLLRTGDNERALQFADPVHGSVTISTVEFLTLLREKDPVAADQRYATMLEMAGLATLRESSVNATRSSKIETLSCV